MCRKRKGARLSLFTKSCSLPAVDGSTRLEAPPWMIGPKPRNGFMPLRHRWLSVDCTGIVPK